MERRDPLEQMVDRHDQDLYRGNHGKLGLTTRMAVMEHCVEMIEKNLSRGIWLLVAILATMLADLLVKHF